MTSEDEETNFRRNTPVPFLMNKKAQNFQLQLATCCLAREKTMSFHPRNQESELELLAGRQPKK